MPQSTAQILVVVAVALGVVAFVAWPLLSKRRDLAGAAAAIDAQRIEDRITDYRRALRQRTVCERCLYANPDGSRFCAQCGARLPAGGAGSQTAGTAARPSD